MTKHGRVRIWRFLALGALLLPLVPEGGAAQTGGRDFLFRRPLFTVGLQVGYAVPMKGSEIYDFATEELTLAKSDFNSATWMGSVAYRVTERVDIGVDVGYANSNSRSEYRDWVDQDDLPIEQNTRLERIPVTFTVRGYLYDRGRRISRFAWVPGDWSPFAGVGFGRMHYAFKQTGDFVDYQTLDVYADTYRSEGSTSTVQLLAGVDYSLGTRFILRGEGRYSWGEADMSRDFVDFDPIDLSGFQGTVGIAVRF